MYVRGRGVRKCFCDVLLTQGSGSVDSRIRTNMDEGRQMDKNSFGTEPSFKLTRTMKTEVKSRSSSIRKNIVQKELRPGEEWRPSSRQILVRFLRRQGSHGHLSQHLRTREWYTVPHRILDRTHYPITLEVSQHLFPWRKDSRLPLHPHFLPLHIKKDPSRHLCERTVVAFVFVRENELTYWQHVSLVVLINN